MQARTRWSAALSTAEAASAALHLVRACMPTPSTGIGRAIQRPLACVSPIMTAEFTGVNYDGWLAGYGRDLLCRTGDRTLRRSAKRRCWPPPRLRCFYIRLRPFGDAQKVGFRAGSGQDIVSPCID